MNFYGFKKIVGAGGLETTPAIRPAHGMQDGVDHTLVKAYCLFDEPFHERAGGILPDDEPDWGISLSRRLSVLEKSLASSS